ncbi:MAG: spore coat U domain-containing protein [Candidatus Tectomicrobia bacterium]|nr:spore coat U domain-containing protein [Candidatus Tectomicrobia bacterium]
MFAKQTIGKLLVGAGVVFVLSCGLSNQATATDTTSNLAVSSQVQSGCTVTATGLSFSVYDPLSVIPLNATATVVVSCTQGTGFTVALDKGTSPEASVDAREMTGGTSGDVMSYDIFRDAARTEPWGDGTAGTFTVAGTGAGLGTGINLIAYGDVPALQNISADTYTDTVLVTVTF